MLTAEQIRATITKSPMYRTRAQRDLAEAQRLLARELSYAEDLRDAETMKFLRSHIDKLAAALA